MRAVERAQAGAYGLVGDCHAHPLGPRRDLIDYGVSLNYPWLTDKGREALSAQKQAA